MNGSDTGVRSRRAVALPPEQRRSTIVAAARPLLVEFGDRVTTRQIADAAGIAEGTIFRVFADKDELIAAVVEDAFDPAPTEAALAAIPPDLEFEASLAAAVEIVRQRVRDLWRLVSSLGTRFHPRARGPLEDSDVLTRLFEHHRDRISVEPAVAARLLRALTLSMTHPMLVGEALETPEIVGLFLYGVARPEKPC